MVAYIWEVVLSSVLSFEQPGTEPFLGLAKSIVILRVFYQSKI